MNLEQTGVASSEHLNGRLPSEEQKMRGPYAVIECFEEIPCNPCVMSCAFNAIQPFDDINDLPFVDFDRCTGCAVCARICPGLAIFIADESKDGEWGTIRLPYEYWPLPAKGERVMALARDGRPLGPAAVSAVLAGGRDKTPLVTLAVKKDRLQDVRGLRFLTAEEAAGRYDETGMPLDIDTSEEATIVCRCEGVTLAEIRALIAAGHHTVDEIKHYSRAGMGPCQGRTCRQIIMSELIRAGAADVDHLDPGSFRPPGGTVTLGQLAEGGPDETNR